VSWGISAVKPKVTVEPFTDEVHVVTVVEVPTYTLKLVAVTVVLSTSWLNSTTTWRPLIAVNQYLHL